MIIAPMTVAVESSITPFAAMTAERKSKTVKRTRYRRDRSPSKKSLLSSSGISAGVYRLSLRMADRLAVRLTSFGE
jgi:hypothetical protein